MIFFSIFYAAHVQQSWIISKSYQVSIILLLINFNICIYSNIAAGMGAAEGFV